MASLQINEIGNLIAFLPTAETEPLLEIDRNNGKIINKFGSSEFRTKEYGFPFSTGGAMFVSNRKIFYIFPLSYQLFITENKKTTKIISYPSSNFNEVDERIRITKTKTEYDIIARVFQLTDEMFLLSKYSYGGRGIGRAYKNYEIISVYGDVIVEKLPRNSSNRICGQIKPGKLISIVYRESENDKIDTYIRILDFNLGLD